MNAERTKGKASRRREPGGGVSLEKKRWRDIKGFHKCCHFKSSALFSGQESVGKKFPIGGLSIS